MSTFCSSCEKVKKCPLIPGFIAERTPACDEYVPKSIEQERSFRRVSILGE